MDNWFYLHQLVLHNLDLLLQLSIFPMVSLCRVFDHNSIVRLVTDVYHVSFHLLGAPPRPEPPDLLPELRLLPQGLRQLPP